MKTFNVNYLASTTFFVMTMLNQCAQANVIKARPPQEKHEISPHLIGYNNNWVRQNHVWRNPTMRFLFRRSSAATLRYPGGTNSSYWDYASNTVFKDLAPSHIKEDWIKALLKQDFANPIEELGLLQEEIGKKFAIVFVANLVTAQDIPSAQPESTQWYDELNARYKAFKAALNRAESVGIPIRYIELGNEYYFSSRYYGDDSSCKTCGGQGAFPHTGKSYATAANYFARKLKADYPDVKIAAIGTIAKSESNARRRYWNSKVVSQLDRSVIDAITVHFYHNNTPAAGFDKEVGVGQTLSSWNRTWSTRVAGAETFDRVPIDRDVEGDWDVWYTEFAAFQHRMQDMWHYAFYVSNVLDYWLRNTNVKLIHKHAWKTSFNDNKTLKPYARALSIWSQASLNQKKAGRIILDKVPKIRDSEHEGVIGWMFTGAEKPKALFVNYTNRTHKIDLGAIDHDPSNKLSITSATSKNLLAGPVAPAEKKYRQKSAVVKLAPFSVSLIKGIDEK